MARYDGEFDGWTQRPDAPVHDKAGARYDAFVFHKKITVGERMLETYCVVAADKAGDVPAAIAQHDAAMLAELNAHH